MPTEQVVRKYREDNLPHLQALQIAVLASARKIIMIARRAKNQTPRRVSYTVTGNPPRSAGYRKNTEINIGTICLV